MTNDHLIIFISNLDNNIFYKFIEINLFSLTLLVKQSIIILSNSVCRAKYNYLFSFYRQMM